VRVGRIQNFGNWSRDMLADPRRSALGLEYFVFEGDDLWVRSDDELLALAARELEQLGLASARDVRDGAVVRVRQAYPIYSIGYEHWFQQLDAWTERVPRLLSYGRQGLFAHDNTHHALAMAYAAAACLEPGGFRQDRWAEHRRVFDTHVVED